MFSLLWIVIVWKCTLDLFFSQIVFVHNWLGKKCILKVVFFTQKTSSVVLVRLFCIFFFNADFMHYQTQTFDQILDFDKNWKIEIAFVTSLLNYLKHDYSNGARNWVGKKKVNKKKGTTTRLDPQFCTWSNYSLSCRSFCLSLPLSTKNFFLCFPLPQSIQKTFWETIFD